MCMHTSIRTYPGHMCKELDSYISECLGEGHTNTMGRLSAKILQVGKYYGRKRACINGDSVSNNRKKIPLSMQTHQDDCACVCVSVCVPECVCLLEATDM